MSVYKTLDPRIPSEVNVNDLSRRPVGIDKNQKVASPPVGPSRAVNDAHFMRRAMPVNEPFAATFKWIAALPREVRPLMLLQKFPRIANIMARAWGDPVMFRDYLFELLIDRRGGREGFPEKVRSELLVLRKYFDELHPGIMNVPPSSL